MTSANSDPSTESDDNTPAFALTSSSLALVSRSPAETAAIGESLAGCLRDGDVVLLHGDLGAGKTTLAKGIASALGVEDVVSSPSFALVNEYDTRHAAVTRLYHLDLYRLRGEEDLASIGFDDYTAPADGITLVEWPERAASSLLPERFLLVEIELMEAGKRRLRFEAIPDDEISRRQIDSLRSRIGSNAD